MYISRVRRGRVDAYSAVQQYDEQERAKDAQAAVPTRLPPKGNDHPPSRPGDGLGREMEMNLRQKMAETPMKSRRMAKKALKAAAEGRPNTGRVMKSKKAAT